MLNGTASTPSPVAVERDPPKRNIRLTSDSGVLGTLWFAWRGSSVASPQK